MYSVSMYSRGDLCSQNDLPVNTTVKLCTIYMFLFNLYISFFFFVNKRSDIYIPTRVPFHHHLMGLSLQRIQMHGVLGPRNQGSLNGSLGAE